MWVQYSQRCGVRHGARYFTSSTSRSRPPKSRASSQRSFFCFHFPDTTSCGALLKLWTSQLPRVSRDSRYISQSAAVTGVLPQAFGGIGVESTATFPTEVASMVSLQQLYMNDNTISDPLPTSIGNLVNLRILHLDDNEISGALPDQIGELVTLTELKIHRNNFQGPLPTTIGNLASLTLFTAYDNGFTSLPSEIGTLSSIETFDMSNNTISGGLPTEIGTMGKLSGVDNLKYLLLANNPIQGIFRGGYISYLSELVELDLTNTQLTGVIFPGIGGLSNLGE